MDYNSLLKVYKSPTDDQVSIIIAFVTQKKNDFVYLLSTQMSFH